MIEKLLDKRNLNRAYKRVVANKGSGGVDGMQVSDLKDHLETYGETLVREIRNGSYRPSPIRGLEIPKSNGKTRLLGVPTAIDRMLQQGLHQVFEPIFEQDFQSNSYGFRPGKNAHQAVSEAKRNINDGYQEVVDIDLKSFFDEVDHGLLLELIYRKVKDAALLGLLRKFLRAPIQIEGKLHKRRKGVPQGSPLSPLLSNIILNELDKELENRGHRYVRYADDFSIYLRSKKAACRVGNSIYKYLRDRLRLPINREKSGIRRPLQLEILGYAFVSKYSKGSKGKYQLVVSKKKWRSLKIRLKSLTRKTNPMSFAERMGRVNWLIRGWINYFKLGSIHTKLKALDEWVRNRIPYCIWHHWKKPEKRRRSLIQLGIAPWQAYAWSRSNMGGWRIAQSPMMKTTITVARLKLKGYISMMEYYHERR